MSDRNPGLFGLVVNWDDIPTRDVRPGVRQKVYSTDQVMLAWHELAVGMDLNPHAHADFDQLVYIESGRCNYFVDGVGHEMGPGAFMLVPRGSEHYAEPTEGPCVNIDIFCPPRPDFQPYVPDRG
jgi:quercetin dioxygenase-like cupin family protein